MTGAYKRGFALILCDLFNNLRCKIYPLIVAVLFCIIILATMVYYQAPNICELNYHIGNLSNSNLALLGVDIAALAILFSLFQDKTMDINAKEAFKEQNISFIGNAFLQLISFLLSIVCKFVSLYVVLYLTLFFQFLSLVLVFDLIIELYTLHSAITNKNK